MFLFLQLLPQPIDHIIFIKLRTNDISILLLKRDNLSPELFVFEIDLFVQVIKVLDFELIFGHRNLVFGDGVFLVLEESVVEIGHREIRITFYFGNLIYLV
jgi:hypothetical protein